MRSPALAVPGSAASARCDWPCGPGGGVLRPGLLVLSVRGAARYFGSEEDAAERLVDAVAAAGAECQVGIADQLATAVFAARAGRIVEPGKDALFLSALSIRQLAT